MLGPTARAAAPRQPLVPSAVTSLPSPSTVTGVRDKPVLGAPTLPVPPPPGWGEMLRAARWVTATTSPFPNGHHRPDLQTPLSWYSACRAHPSPAAALALVPSGSRTGGRGAARAGRGDGWRQHPESAGCKGHRGDRRRPWVSEPNQLLPWCSLEPQELPLVSPQNHGRDLAQTCRDAGAAAAASVPQFPCPRAGPSCTAWVRQHKQQTRRAFPTPL